MHVLFDAPQIANLTRSVARDIGTDFPQGVVLAPILRGGMIFCSDLARLLPGDVRIAPIVASRKIHHMLDDPDRVEVDVLYPSAYDGRDVVLVEGVLDTGLTIASVKRALEPIRTRSVSTACLVWKREKTREANVSPRYCGTVIGDRYVFGYGMDRGGRDRQLPYLACLDDEELAALR